MNLPIKIGLILITLIAGFYTPDVINLIKNHSKHSISIRNLDQYCMLSTQACIQDDIAITLDKNILQPMVSSRIKVLWSKNQSLTTQASKLTLTMTGLEGKLGRVKYNLKQTGDNIYEGDITLPVCTLDEMTWLGELTDGNKTVYPALRMRK